MCFDLHHIFPKLLLKQYQKNPEIWHFVTVFYFASIVHIFKVSEKIFFMFGVKCFCKILMSKLIPLGK